METEMHIYAIIRTQLGTSPDMQKIGDGRHPSFLPSPIAVMGHMPSRPLLWDN